MRGQTPELIVDLAQNWKFDRRKLTHFFSGNNANVLRVIDGNDDSGGEVDL